jgi:hypothetical protein
MPTTRAKKDATTRMTTAMVKSTRARETFATLAAQSQQILVTQTTTIATALLMRTW